MIIVPPASFGARGTSLINHLKNLGLTTNLKICLDAGDLNSYDGTSQSWKDLSGNGTDFYRGSGSGSDGADPTFNGTAGKQSSGEYFSGDGGDYFTLASANPSWVDALHKSGGKFTIIEWEYLNGIASTADNFGNVGSASLTGAGIIAGSSTSTVLSYTISVFNDGDIAYAKKTTALASNNQWNFLAVSVDMGAGNVSFLINGTIESYAGQSFANPSTNGASQPLEIGAEEGTLSIDKSGCRWGQFAMWNAAQSSANLVAIFNATKGRFGF